jgi:small-conductance mechanosensitive channel
MSYEEKSTWVQGVLAVVTLAVYAGITLGQAATVPLTETPYATTMLWTIVGSIVVSIVIHIGLGLFSRDRKKDQRDREFHSFGERVGNGFLVAGTLAALVMAWLEWDWFWIANVIYLGFVFSAILSSIAKLVAYRRGIVGAAW